MRTQNWHVAPKYAFIKKSTIFSQFLWDLVKMTTLWVGHFDQVSNKLEKNCGYFNKSIFRGHMSILGPHSAYCSSQNNRVQSQCFVYAVGFQGSVIPFDITDSSINLFHLIINLIHKIKKILQKAFCQQSCMLGTFFYKTGPIFENMYIFITLITSL